MARTSTRAGGAESLREAARALKRAERVLLSCHERPDGDALGSCLGLAASLKAAGKKADVVNISGAPENLLFLPGAKSVKTQPVKRAHYDLAITTDSGDLSRLAWDLKALRESGRVRAVLNLDHHKDNTGFGDLNYVDLQASSSGEVAYDVIRRANLPLNRNVATNLYTAITTDTGFFRYSNTTEKTMKTATHLLEYGVEPWKVAEALEMSWPRERIELLADVLRTLEISDDARWAALTVLRETMARYGDRYDLMEGFVNYPRSISSVEVAIIFKEVDDESWRVSLRSKSRVDVGTIANRLGGGGHARAAGLSLEGSREQVRRQVISLVEEALAGR